MSFSVRVPGKWVLVGEHSVLRGGAAIALPHPELSLTLRFEEASSGGLEIEPDESIVHSIFELAPKDLVEPALRLRGRLRIESDIPVGAGLGSSAAFCVAIVRWMAWAARLELPGNELRAVATRLENHFHGKSSGMDVAACVAAEPIRFSMSDGPCPLGVRKIPRFTFHDSGIRVRTRDCVEKVNEYARSHLGTEVDGRMADSVRAALDGLCVYDQGDRMTGLAQIRVGMNDAHQCFVEWGLVPPPVIELRQRLLREGALAAKLTGSGGGGMMVALWE